jgi:hypothetical protein
MCCDDPTPSKGQQEPRYCESCGRSLSPEQLRVTDCQHLNWNDQGQCVQCDGISCSWMMQIGGYSYENPPDYDYCENLATSGEDHTNAVCDLHKRAEEEMATADAQLDALFDAGAAEAWQDTETL